MEVFEKSKMKAIIGALSEGPKHIRELLVLGGSASTIQDRVNELLDLGLAEEEVSKKWPFRRTIRLTSNGKRIAKFLEMTSDSGLFREKSEQEQKDIIFDLSGIDSSMGRKKWILDLLRTMGGEVRGSTRLVKLLFLLQKEYDAVGTDFYEFHPYTFGPFSEDILNDAEELRKLELIEIWGEVYAPRDLMDDWVVSKNFRLTPKGERLADSIYKELPERAKDALAKLDKFNKMKLIELLNYVYKEYPEESTGE